MTRETPGRGRSSDPIVAVGLLTQRDLDWARLADLACARRAA